MENLVADHLSHLPQDIEPLLLKDEFLDEQLFLAQQITLWYNDIVNFLVTCTF